MEKRPGRRLTKVDVVVGALSGADPESLEFALGLLAAESQWPNAEMDVRQEPVVLTCRGCGREYPMDDMCLTCPGCGGADVEPVRGTQLRLESLEVE
jgi:hydrogenase nickel incorporation protein HypA/HybF